MDDKSPVNFCHLDESFSQSILILKSFNEVSHRLHQATQGRMGITKVESLGRNQLRNSATLCNAILGKKTFMAKKKSIFGSVYTTIRCIRNSTTQKTRNSAICSACNHFFAHERMSVDGYWTGICWISLALYITVVL